eukprot:g32552.t1
MEIPVPGQPPLQSPPLRADVDLAVHVPRDRWWSPVGLLAVLPVTKATRRLVNRRNVIGMWRHRQVVRRAKSSSFDEFDLLDTILGV